MNDKKKIKISLTGFILIVVLIIILSTVSTYMVITHFQKTNSKNIETSTNTINKIEEKKENVIKTIDLNYELLKIENNKENKVYSPLSIKYALKMLEEASNGETKEQISNIISKYNLTKYDSNKNFSLANAFFIKDSFKDTIKDTYINTLKNKYNAEINFDLFENAKNLNNWISKKTFKIIPSIIDDENMKGLDFALINALAIDMEWDQKFIINEYMVAEYFHEKRDIESSLEGDEYSNKIINVQAIDNVSKGIFEKENNEIEISGMKVYATINNYDIINELGEENIKDIVSKEYSKFAKGELYDTEHASGDFLLSEDVSDEGIKKALEEYLPNYISELNNNYHKYGTSTDFSIYVDEDVKVFAKDLKEYNDTTLQYIGIMPISENLNEFINNINTNTINKYISNLKDIHYKNFKEGVVTRIYGYIPKFNFEYSWNLMKNLQLCNITNVFDKEKADLSKMTTEENAYIGQAIHKANIEFTQDGIKAAAATLLGGLGGGDPFDYKFGVPVEDIDITFDKPYIFLIRDIETNEVWFVGTVYEPFLWEEEPEKNNVY